MNQQRGRRRRRRRRRRKRGRRRKEGGGSRKGVGISILSLYHVSSVNELFTAAILMKEYDEE